MRRVWNTARDTWDVVPNDHIEEASSEVSTAADIIDEAIGPRRHPVPMRPEQVLEHVDDRS